MRELDSLVGAYVHLDKLPRANEALRELQKIASLVKPLMRNRGWHVGTLTEFWPEQQNLLGLNVNRGQKICLRLRYAGDRTQFLPLDSCVDTMLHELCHNIIGPHDASFHKLWNELRDEYTDLKIKGYTGEGFLSDGKRLGGAKIPMHEMRRQRRIAAEKRNSLVKGSGQKLGGKPVSRDTNIRDVITNAVERRQTITQGCASGTRNSQQIADEATRNGFRTQAEEDQANDRAIAEALWELAQQDEVNQEPQDPKQWRSDGLKWNPHTGLEASSPEKRNHADMDDAQAGTGTWFLERDSGYEQAEPEQGESTKQTNIPPAAVRRSTASFGQPRPDSDTLGTPSVSQPPPLASSRTKPKVYLPEKLPKRPPPIQEHPAFRNSTSSSNSSEHSAAPSVSSITSSNHASQSPHPSAFMSPIEGRGERNSIAAPTPLSHSIQLFPAPPMQLQTTWTCPACTLVNPGNYLCCDACANPRPCHGTIDDFSSMTDLGPDALPAQSPSSPAELPGSGYFRSSTTSSLLHESQRPQRPTSLPPALRTARSLAAATKTAKPVHDRKLGWKCECGAFMEEVWWICSACGKMKTSS